MTTFVLIPGAGGQAWYWHRLAAELERRGCDAIPVDLPAGDDTAGLAAYTDAVLRALEGRAVDGSVDGEAPVVVVAQSMGGFVAPLVCARVPVERLVLVNPMIPLPGETGGQWWTATGHERAIAEHAARDGLSGDAGDQAEYFFHDVPPEVVAAAFEQPFEQSGRPFEDPWPLPAWPDVPTYVVIGSDDRFFPVDFQRRLAAERLGCGIDVVPGGHLVALSRPAELADRLESFLTPT
jgi:pimeloyl-ACP methyl ester carboxylesterase